MPLRNSARRYGSVSIALHWLGAIAVVLMLASAIPIYANRADHARQLPYIVLHAAMGATLFALIAARILWHFVERQPAKLSPDRRLNRLASGVHVALLLLIGSQIVTGPLDVWSGGFALRLFDWGEIPSPFAGPQPWHDAIGVVHRWSGLGIALLVGLHWAGVAKHFLYDDDDTVARMFGLMEKKR